MKKYSILILFLILLASFILRIYKIDSVPPGLGNDEISIAYDSYSLSILGRDSNGFLWPISFKSHNTYKAPLYHYLAAPVIRILGNNEFTVRLPSVIFGVLTVLTIYLFVTQIANNEKLGFFSAFLLSITPWHIYTSRIALEANIALFFVVLGLYLSFLGRSKSIYLYLSSIVLALSIYSYHAEWVFTPIIMIIFALVFLKDFMSSKKILLWFLLTVALCLPLVINIFIGAGGTRAATENLLKDHVLVNQLSGVSNIFSKYFIIVSFWLQKYFSYLNLNYIFIDGLDISATYGISDFGLLNLFELPVFILGILYLGKRLKEKYIVFLLVWIFVGTFLSSLTEGDTNLGRYLVNVVPFTIVSAMGIEWIQLKFHSKYVFSIFLLGLTLNFLFFYRYYISQFPFHFAEKWTYGFKQVAKYIGENQLIYKKIVVDPRFGVVNNSFIGVPSLYILYFNHLDPQEYLNTKFESDKELNFLKYTIRNVDWTNEEISPNTLYVVSRLSIPLKRDENIIRKIHSVSLPDGTEAFQFYESF